MPLAAEHSLDVRTAVERAGLRAREVGLLSPPDPRKRNRSAWRVDLEDGGTVKARRLESAAAARELRALREGVDPAFVAVVGCHEAVLLEEWVDGQPLSDDAARARAGEAGALLGRLHAAPHPAVATGRWRTQAERDLDSLDAARVLDAREVASLRCRLAAQDPGASRGALVHRDFCAENMLVDPRGRLRVIDNEWFAIDAAGLDLARTLYRWPMDDGPRGAFLAAYRDAAGSDAGPLGFWELVAVLWSARARLDQPADRRGVPIEVVRRLAAREYGAR